VPIITDFFNSDRSQLATVPIITYFLTSDRSQLDPCLLLHIY